MDGCIQFGRGQRCVQQRQGDPPGLADRRFSPGQRKRTDPANTAEGVQCAAQDLAAPDRAIGSESGAIEGDSQDLPIEPAGLNHPGSNVSMMMLNADDVLDASQLWPVQGPLGIAARPTVLDGSIFCHRDFVIAK